MRLANCCGQPAGQIMLTKISLILLTVILTACQSNTNINGHWHSLTEAGTHRTLDITDTLTIANKLVLNHLFYIECLRKHPDSISSTKLYLPLNEWTATDKYYLNGDTLIIGDGLNFYKYKRSNLNECEIADRYQYLPLVIKPPLGTEFRNHEVLEYSEDFGSIFLGTDFKDPLSSFSLLKGQYPDTVFVQVSDYLITLDAMQRVCSEFKSEFDLNVRASLVLHVDTSVNQLFLDKLIRSIPTDFDVYRTVIDSKNSLGLIKLR